MFISLAESRTAGFLKWVAAHRLAHDGGVAKPIALIRPPPDRNALEDDQPHRPWAIPGVGNAL
jgi:hypothetical protein